MDVASPLRPFRALRQPVFMTVRRGAFFYRWKGVKEYESEIIIGVIEGLITPETLGYEDYPCEMTMNRWLSEKNRLLKMYF